MMISLLKRNQYAGGSAEKMNLLISIVIPCYNAEKTLERTIASVLGQRYDHIEVIIVDDGSTDRTAEIIQRHKKACGCIKSISQKNRGVSAARNTGASVAQGDWIAFLDADDIFYKNSLTDRVAAIHSKYNENMLGVFCSAEFVYADGRKMGFGPMFRYSGAGGRVYFSMTPECLFPPSCVIVNKNHFFVSGGFDEQIAPAEDYDLWHRMMRSGGYFQYVHTCKVGYMQHPESAVRSKMILHYQQWKKVAGRIAAASDGGIDECRNGYGKSLYHISLTGRALSTAFMAIATRQYQIVDALIADISLYALDAYDVQRIESIMKFAATRALCRHQNDWYLHVWPAIRSDIITFFEKLDQKFSGRSQNIKELLEICRKQTDRMSSDSRSDKSLYSRVGHGVSNEILTLFFRLKNFMQKTSGWLRSNQEAAILLGLFCLIYTLLVVITTIIMVFFIVK